MKTENLIGKVLAIDENQIERAKTFLKSKVVPAVQEVTSQYRALDSMPTLSQKIWEEIISTSGDNVAKKFKDQASKDMEGFKNSAIRTQVLQAVEGAISPFIKSVVNAQNICSAGPAHSLLITPACVLTDIEIKDGEPHVKLERIRETCTLRIETEDQARLYEAGKAAEAALAELKKAIETTTSIDMARVPWMSGGGQLGIFWEPHPGDSPVFDADIIGLVKQVTEAV